MFPPVPDDAMTREADLVNWQAFSLAYYETIRRALRLLRVPDAEVDELAHSFLVKAAEKNFLGTFHAAQAREAEQGRRIRFRTYLYRSLQYHVVDYYRKRKGGGEHVLSPEASEGLVASSEATLDPDALYALDVLHQALQALRRHCERTGKPHLWVFFEELLLADEFRGRKGKTREDLLAGIPGARAQYIDNCLTTAKRAFRRFIQELVPRGLRDDVPSAERFEEWMDILRHSNASQFNLLHVAYQVAPSLNANMTQVASNAMVVGDQEPTTRYEEPSLLPDNDELSLLLSFRLELPLVEMLDAAELQAFISPASPLWHSPRPGRGSAAPRPPQPPRPMCLLTLVEPTPDETVALEKIDLVGLLSRLKSLAKQLRRHADHAMPEVFAQLLYTMTNVVAMVRCGAELHTIGAHSMTGNIRWFLKEPWLDNRLRPLFEAGLAILEATTVIPAPPAN